MKTKKNDFVEIDFVARIKDGNVFDTTKEEEAKKAGLISEKAEKKDQFKPLSVCIGQGMLIKGLDKALENKEVGKDYRIELKPSEAFGLRDAKLIKTVALSSFKEMPQRGMFVNVDGIVARVVTVTSGRALLDFNNPLAGKPLMYDIQIIRIIKESKVEAEKVEVISLGVPAMQEIQTGLIRV